MQIIALSIATAIPILAFFLIYKLDLYRMGTFRFIFLSGAAGIAAFVAAFYFNTAVMRAGLVSRNQVVWFVAPIAEEVFKGLILLYLVRQPRFTYFVDGAIYGFAAGIGFAVPENWYYVLNASGTGLGVAIGRVISTNLMHASASALVGIAFGLSRFSKGGARRFSQVAVGLLVAWTLHLTFNNMVSRLNMGLVVVFAAVVGFGSAIGIALTMRRGLATQKLWIKEKLGMADRVTTGEAAAVQKLASLSEVLTPLEAQFGREKAAQVERFLRLQAKLGIQRKAMEEQHDEKIRAGIKKQIDELRHEMDTARKAVGSYVMLHLRNTFPPLTDPIWGRMEAAIQQSIAARPAQGGMNLWANLEKRAKESSTETENKQ